MGAKKIGIIQGRYPFKFYFRRQLSRQCGNMGNGLRWEEVVTGRSLRRLLLGGKGK